MNRFLLTALVMFALTGAAEARECEECTAENRCTIEVPGSDGCNVCVYEVWCREDRNEYGGKVERWMRTPTAVCTSVYCSEVPLKGNPFLEEGGDTLPPREEPRKHLPEGGIEWVN